MKFIGLSSVGMIVALLAVGCASDAKRRSERDMIVVDQKSDRQTVVEFDGACAMALANGEYQLGNRRYLLQHDGKTYYFRSLQAKLDFEKDIKNNADLAARHWQARANAG